MANAPERLSTLAGIEAKGDEVVAATTEASHTASSGPAAEAKRVSHKGSNEDGQQDIENGTALKSVKTGFGDRPECFKNTFQEVGQAVQSSHSRSRLLK